MKKYIAAICMMLCMVNIVNADINCDGVDDALTSGLAISNFITTTAYTVTGWVIVMGSTAGFSSQTSCWGGGPFVMDEFLNFVMGRKDTDEYCLYHYGVTEGDNLISSGTVTTAQHHIAGRLSSGTLTLFIDGVSVGSDSSLTALADASQLLFACGVTDNAMNSDRISHLKVYNVALSDNEIANLGRSRIDMKKSNPTGEWRLDDCADGASGDGVSFKDRSGNGRNLTGNNGANNTGLTCKASSYIARPWGVN